MKNYNAKESARKRQRNPRTRDVSLTSPYRVHQIQRKVRLSSGDLDLTGALAVGKVYFFSLDEMPEYTECSALFDQYRVDSVTIELLSEANVNTTTPAGALFTLPHFYSCIDLTDVTPITSENEILAYSSCQLHQHGVMKRTLSPCFSTRVFDTALVDGFTTRRGWLESANPSIPHYGIKVYAPTRAVYANQPYKCYLTIKCSFRGVK